MNLLSLLILLALLTMFSLVWLWLMTARPGLWGAWVDKENNFWVAKGWITGAFAEKIKRLEKGRTLKILAGMVALMGAAGLAVSLVIFQSQAHPRFKVMLPPKTPMQRPPTRHPTNKTFKNFNGSNAP